VIGGRARENGRWRSKKERERERVRAAATAFRSAPGRRSIFPDFSARGKSLATLGVVRALHASIASRVSRCWLYVSSFRFPPAPCAQCHRRHRHRLADEGASRACVFLRTCILHGHISAGPAREVVRHSCRRTRTRTQSGAVSLCVCKCKYVRERVAALVCAVDVRARAPSACE
jgi:hypothetical protein